MEIQNIKTDKLIPYVNNPRHNEDAVEKVMASIHEFGFKVPLVIDKNNVVVTGHTRLKAAKKLGIEEVPCVVADDLSDAQIKAFRIADNKVSEYAEWDEELLQVELEQLEELDFNLDSLSIDFSDFDLDVGEDIKEIEPEEVEIPEVPEEPKAKLGDIYQLGNHRLMCGDSTSANDVKKLMNGEKADMVFTDPPYNCNYGNIKHPKFKVREIENDNMSTEAFTSFCIDFTTNIKTYTKGCVYMCAGQGKDGRVMFTVADNILHNSTTIIWNKDRFTLGRGKYQNKYEPIWFGWVENGSDFTEDRTITNVWDIKRPTASDLHPTMKPIELIATALNHNPKSNSVLDLFGGSGSTLIACEQLNRKCYMMELDPHYVDVIIKRWEDYTGNKAIKLE